MLLLCFGSSALSREILQPARPANVFMCVVEAPPLAAQIAKNAVMRAEEAVALPTIVYAGGGATAVDALVPAMPR